MRLSPKRAGSVAYSAVMFVIVSMVAGLLVAGLAVPVAALAGVGGHSAEDAIQDLPKEFKTPPQPVKSKVLLGNGEVLTHFFDQDRTYVKLKDISPAMRTAQLAIEDHRFYEHGALDVTGTLRAFVKNMASGDVSQGGSSITQQYVKMVRIQQAELAGDKEGIEAAQSDNYARKITELKYAIGLEKKFSKDQILERYLNIAYYGNGAYGVQAAAHRYFDTSAKKLTLPQAAMLAGLVKSPNANNPVDHPQAGIKRRNVVLNHMAELGDITSKRAKKAKETGFDKSKVQSSQNGCVDTEYPFLCNYVYKSLLKTPSLGKTKQDRKNTIMRGGLTIQTKIDPQGQDKAQQAVSDYIDAKDPVIATMSMIEPGTGLILGMAQNRPKMGSHSKKGETYYNYPATQAMGGSPGGFQSGSTFKAITIAAALNDGVKPSKKYNAKSPLDMSGERFKTCKGSFRPPNYKPQNSTGVNGRMNMRKAAKYSVNTYFLQLEQTIGICKVAKMADKLGVKLPNGKKIQDSKYASAPSLTLGVANIAPLSLAEAYATFANRGVRCDPVMIDKIKNRKGKELKTRGANCKRVIPKDVADGVNDILHGVMSGTGRPAKLHDNRDVAGKTGTTDDNQALWFAGYTPQVAGVASISEDFNRPRFKKGNRPPNGLKNFHLKHSNRTLQGSGGGDAGNGIWKPAMLAALQGKPRKHFAEYSKKKKKDSDDNGRVKVPDVSGLSAEKATDKLEDSGFSVTRTWIYSSRPAGQFVRFSQYGGKLSKHSTIYAYYSAGSRPKKQSSNHNRNNNGNNNNNNNNGNTNNHNNNNGDQKKHKNKNKKNKKKNKKKNHNNNGNKNKKKSNNGGKKSNGKNSNGHGKKKSHAKKKSGNKGGKKSNNNNNNGGGKKSNNKKSDNNGGKKSNNKKSGNNNNKKKNNNNKKKNNKKSDGD